jgi:hypothetical protein
MCFILLYDRYVSGAAVSAPVSLCGGSPGCRTRADLLPAATKSLRSLMLRLCRGHSRSPASDHYSLGALSRCLPVTRSARHCTRPLTASSQQETGGRQQNKPISWHRVPMLQYKVGGTACWVADHKGHALTTLHVLQQHAPRLQ